MSGSMLQLLLQIPRILQTRLVPRTWRRRRKDSLLLLWMKEHYGLPKLLTCSSPRPGRPPKPSQEKKISGEMNGVVQKKSQPFSQNRASRLDGMNSGPGRPSERRTSGPMNGVVQRKPPAPLPDKSKNPEDSSLRAKLEAAKRKLQENYQNAENAKRQRTV